jgi:hypothetical protein
MYCDQFLLGADSARVHFALARQSPAKHLTISGPAEPRCRRLRRRCDKLRVSELPTRRDLQLDPHEPGGFLQALQTAAPDQLEAAQRGHDWCFTRRFAIGGRQG